MNDLEYEQLRQRVRRLLRIDLAAYKPQQMRRRLESYVARSGHATVGEFLDSLSTDVDAVRDLRNMLTINVSEFFRDAEQFERLATDILPALLRAKQGTLNVWSAACSHGEEPYSIAIILRELAASHRSKILATDIDREVLAKAQDGGPYHPNEMRNVSPKRRIEYFNESGGAFTIVDAIRSRVAFREMNLLEDRFERGFDLIVCRNVMIYFSDETKQTLFERLHDSLLPGGVLFLGGAEALLATGRDTFERLGGNFYRRPAAAAAAAAA
jgi:chemotaxis protein methyltransferase CheR